MRNIRVIVAQDGELVTGQELALAKVENGNLVSDPCQGYFEIGCPEQV